MFEKLAEKSFEFWVALAAGVLIAFDRHKDSPLLRRSLIAAISGLIAFSQAEGVAEWANKNINLVVLFLGGFGYLLLEILTSLITDREFIKNLVRRWLLGTVGERDES